jgi:hypothetical protein
MRSAIVLGALICASPLVLLSATASDTERRVTVDYCQPLTTANLEECCVDPRWRELIWPDHVRFCPPLSADDGDSGRLGESVADSGDGGNVPGTDVDPDPGVVIDPETTGSIVGPNNPGNQLPVGGAGEKGMDNESPKTGDQGNKN